MFIVDYRGYQITYDPVMRVWRGPGLGCWGKTLQEVVYTLDRLINQGLLQTDPVWEAIELLDMTASDS